MRPAAGGDGVPEEDGRQAEPRAPPEPEREGEHAGGGALSLCAKQTVNRENSILLVLSS